MLGWNWKTGKATRKLHQESRARNWYTGERDESSYDEP